MDLKLKTLSKSGIAEAVTKAVKVNFLLTYAVGS
jgi:hypothetical protein